MRATRVDLNYLGVTEELPFLDPTTMNPPLDMRLVTDDQGIEEMCEYLGTLELIGYDIETNVVDLFTDRKVRTVQLGDRTRQYVVDLLALAGSEDALKQQGNRTSPAWAQSLTNALQRFVSSRAYLKVGQNLAFEHETILWNLGVSGRNYYDTMISEKVLRCGEFHLFAKDVWGLKDLVARYYGKRLNKGEQKGFDLHTPLKFSQIEYAGLDIRIPIAVREKQMHEAKKERLERATQIDNDAIPAFSEMKVNGLPVDEAEWNALVESNEVQHRKNVAELDKFFVPMYGTREAPVMKVSEGELYAIEMVWRNETDKELRSFNRDKFYAARREYADRMKDAHKWEGRAAVNYGSDEMILEGLHKMGYSVVATNEKALGRIKDEPVVKAIVAYRETHKALTTYGSAYLDSINPHTGRIHSSFQQLGAETGRTSSTKPNVQQLPPENRHTVKARPGHVIITTDMSGAELRIMAELSGHTLWIEMFAKGWDVHSVGAEMIFGQEWKDAAAPDCEYYKSTQKCKCKKHKEMRDAIKTINFGIAYGMSQYALAGRLGISTQDALALLTKWREVNAVLAAYLKKSGETAKLSLEARTMSGFKRKFKAPVWQKSKETAMQRSEKDKGHINIDTRDIQKVYGAAWGSIEREGTNTPIQGSNAAIAKVAMGAGVDREGNPFMFDILPTFEAQLINFVHDEFVVECPADRAEECAEAVRDCIRRAGAEFMTKIVMEAESNISERWEK